MKKYFYCENCKTEVIDFQFDRERKDKDKVTWINSRDGYGRFIIHIIRPFCGDVLNGYIEIRPNEDINDKYVLDYFKDVLQLYQTNRILKDINGLKNQIKQDLIKRNK